MTPHHTIANRHRDGLLADLGRHVVALDADAAQRGADEHAVPIEPTMPANAWMPNTSSESS